MPPVTKPAKKLETLSIPGANGDIVTSEGGYEPYDRKFTVGVSRSLGDLEQIVQYLEQDGSWVWSNEPDKIYTARQTARFDFARMARHYKTDITVTVQPIKRGILPPVLYSDWTAEYDAKLYLPNDGNTRSEPSYSFELQSAPAWFILWTNEGSHQIVVGPRSEYNNLKITLDTATGNATGTLVYMDDTTRTGYLTDLVEVRNVETRQYEDITALRLPAGGEPAYIKQVEPPPGESSSVAFGVSASDTTAYI